MSANASVNRNKKNLVAQRTWRDELDLVRGALLLFAAALAGALLVVSASSWIGAAKHEAMVNATHLRQVAGGRLKNVETEKREIQAYQPRFLELQAAGLVGGENRLAWIEALRLSQARRKLPSISYEIEPQQALVMDQPFKLGDYRLLGSRMQLQAGLVHELDLFDLLADLRHAGLFTVENCKLRRGAIQPDANAAPGMVGECSLLWLSLGAPPDPNAAARGSP